MVTKDMVQTMKTGAVIIDVAIDQGGCIETSKPTTHSNPIYKEYDVIHYCVTNIPGAVACTSTHALTNVTLPYALEIADKGYERSPRKSCHIERDQYDKGKGYQQGCGECLWNGLLCV